MSKSSRTILMNLCRPLSTGTLSAIAMLTATALLQGCGADSAAGDVQSSQAMAKTNSDRGEDAGADADRGGGSGGQGDEGNGAAGAAHAGASHGGAARPSALIRRTGMGVPHIVAQDWRGLGFGVGHVQAEDTLCTIADSMLTYRGERAKYLGEKANIPYDSTIGMANNLESDFFHRHILNDAAITRLSQSQPAELKQLVEGFAQGYNVYLERLRKQPDRHAACRDAAWVRPIEAKDIWRRLYAANFAGGYSNFLALISSAQPPATAGGASPAGSAAPSGTTKSTLPAAGSGSSPVPESSSPEFQLRIDRVGGIGSNMYGFGTQATGGASPLLFGNPHWFWFGPDRFYQAQYTIPGTINVSGVSFLGIPLVQIGFTRQVAWSHTVSTARRFGFFMLGLDPANPTRYLRDGALVDMKASTIEVQALQPDGSMARRTRTLYRTDQGPLINLGALNPALAWDARKAFVVRDINEQNDRLYRTWLRWARANSLEEFAAIQKEEASIPWVNTVAVSRDSGEAWYADIGAVPNVSPARMAACATPVGPALAAALPRVPVLDGTRSSCDWETDADSRQPGALGPSRMPGLMRADYVANMNDSYWLTNVHAPMTGFPEIMGPAGTQSQSMRSRLGHLQVLDRLSGRDGLPGRNATSSTMRSVVLSNRVYSAERYKDEMLGLVCNAPTIDIDSASAPVVTPGGTPAPAASVTVDVQAACAVLRAWDNHGNQESRGSHLWDEFWNRITLKEPSLFTVPFDAADPLNTPRGVNPAAAPVLKQAFARGVQAAQASGFALDAPRGEVHYSLRNGEKIPLYGGCTPVGYFTVLCSENPITQGGYTMDNRAAHGNSYIQMVDWVHGQPRAYTLLTHSLSDDPANPHFSDYTKRTSRKDWLRVPFAEWEILADPDLRLQFVRAN